MHDVGHAVAQLAALFARYPWQSFAVVMAAVKAASRRSRSRKARALTG